MDKLNQEAAAGDYLTLEDGSGVLLLEQQYNAATFAWGAPQNVPHCPAPPPEPVAY